MAASQKRREMKNAGIDVIRRTLRKHQYEVRNVVDSLVKSIITAKFPSSARCLLATMTPPMISVKANTTLANRSALLKISKVCLETSEKSVKKREIRRSM